MGPLQRHRLSSSTAARIVGDEESLTEEATTIGLLALVATLLVAPGPTSPKGIQALVQLARYTSN